MKTYLKILLLFFSVFLCLASVGCASQDEEDEGKLAVSEAQESAETASIAFVEALACGDFESALMLTEAYSEDGFVYADDIEWYLPRSSFANVRNLGFELFKASAEGEENEGEAVYEVTLYDASETTDNPAKKTFKVKLRLNDDNDWVICAPEFYCTDFLFRTAGGDTKVYIDGKYVSEDYCEVDEAGEWELCKDYLIPYIGKNNIEVRITCDNYDYTQTLTPNTNNVISASVSVFKPVENPAKCFSFIKDTWNAMCAQYLVGETASCVENYIARNASYDLCNIVWDGFEQIHVGNSSQGGFKNENYNLTVCKASSKGNVYWISDTQVMCNFDYELTWYYTFGKTNQSTHQTSSAILSLENGVYKFYEFTDTGLFFEANHYSNEW